MTDILPRRSVWLFEGASWICLVAAIMLPGVCWLVLPKERIADSVLSIALAHRVSRLFHLEGAVIAIGVFSLFGVRKWKPIGIIVRSLLGIGAACVGGYLLAAWAFALSFWR
jgi:hypothetical protein